MNDLISRQAAMLKVAKVNVTQFESIDDFHDACVDCLQEVPSSERKKGKWLYPFETTTLVATCSKCGGNGNGRMNYCPNCGADMRGGQDG